MNIIETSAPIKIEDLKKYFLDKETFYVVDYESSEIKGKKLLTYLSNLDIPCDLKINASSQEFLDLLKEYLTFPLIVNIPFLEKETVKMLLQLKKVNDFGYANFIEENSEVLEKWTQILDSLLYYNTYSINDPEYKDFIKNSNKFDNSLMIGVNFVSLLKYEDFYDFYTTVDPENFKYHEIYFNDYVFKGKNLFYYWATERNPVYLITWAIEADKFDPEEFANAMRKDIEEIQSVSLI